MRCIPIMLFPPKQYCQSVIHNTKLLLPLNFLPCCCFHLDCFRACSTGPTFDSIPHIARGLTSIVSNDTTSTTICASTRTARQPSEHAAPTLSLLLLIQTSSLSRTHFLSEQVLLVACWMACRH